MTKMKETEKVIRASKDLKEEIAAKFKVTVRTVESALTFATNSPSARLFRAYALNHGAKMYEVREVENPYTEVITL